MKYKRKCKYCENKEGHILEQKKNLIYVKEKLKGVV